MRLQIHGANRTEVSFEDGTRIFFSYETPVAAYLPGEGMVQTEKKWSVTTSKHVGQFGAANTPKKPQSFFDSLALARGA